MWSKLIISASRAVSSLGFGVLRDSVFDAMHLLPLNVVKNNVERWVSGDYLNKMDLNTHLSKMPWTVGN